VSHVIRLIGPVPVRARNGLLSLPKRLRLAVGRTRPGLVVDIEKLVRHGLGHAAFRSFDQILFERFDPEFPARLEFLELALPCGNELTRPCLVDSTSDMDIKYYINGGFLWLLRQSLVI